MSSISQLLDRKPNLRPIWKAGIERRSELDPTVDIGQICDEVVDQIDSISPRHTKILIDGVLIEYKKRLDQVYDYVNQIMEEAWTKSAPDPTILPRGKEKARYEDVTLLDMGDDPTTSNMTENAEQDTRRPFPTKRKAKGSPSACVIDTERTIISGPIFQDWLGSTSDIEGRKKWTCPQRKTVSELIELPPGAIISGFDTVTGQVHYPAPILALWRECSNAHLQNDSASRRMSSGEHQEPSSTSARQRPNQKDTSAFPFFDDFLRGDGFQELKLSIEKDMTIHENTQLRDAALLTPGSSGSSSEPGRTPCAYSGHDSFQMAMGPELPSIGRVKLKQRTSSNKSFGSLEDIPLQDPTYKDITLQVTETETGLTMLPIPPGFKPPDAGTTAGFEPPDAGATAGFKPPDAGTTAGSLDAGTTAGFKPPDAGTTAGLFLHPCNE
ncbi:hypothetical protein H6P81_001900 [Aristolochia fimbriata]|uniref:Uncharacterized protein n=1 Tax=Aristolochia fimbriata TaxID=158543 RepID=A0AAV7FBG9_ARIFI|nr:hypothetical protein H6P81_001900 [Aristolochia fimbriata]